jgi:Uma2 family endonuclease
MSKVQTTPGEPLRPLELERELRRLWSRDEFRRAGEAGLFGPEERVELIGGEITRKIRPQNSGHASAIGLVAEALRRVLPHDYHVRVQLPLAVSVRSEPEPDLAVVAGAIRDYEGEHPSSARLVVEVADVTLGFDRTVKASLYASVSIPEYWIVNLRDLALEVHREPAAMADQPFGYHYRSITRLTVSDVVSIGAIQGGTVAVVDLLPHVRSR